MWKKFLIVCAFVVGVFLINSTGVSAANDCSANFDPPASRSLKFCVGGFSSGQLGDLQNTKANVVLFHPCPGIGNCSTPQSLSLSSPGPDGRGNFFACAGLDVGEVNTSATITFVDKNGATICSTSKDLTDPTLGKEGGACRTGILDSRCDPNLVCISGICSSCPGATGNETGCDFPDQGGPAQTDITSDVNGTCGKNYIYTAIGCVPIGDQNALIGFFLKWGLGIGGGIAFLLILVAGFQIMSSRGDPNRLKAGQELMTSAVAGLLLLIFSLVILRIIGYDILKIPAFF